MQKSKGEEMRRNLKNIHRFKNIEDTKLNTDLSDMVKKWIDRGDGIAVYENHDLGHRNYGHRKFCSYGSKHAQIEVKTANELPERLPDIGDKLNWRYILIGVYRKKGEKK